MNIGKQLALPALIIVAGFGFAASAQEGAKPAAKKPRVFFVEPKNGATVTSPLHMKFGSEGVEIAAVPPGEITKAQVRKGIAHYHVGIDQSCLPAGKTIVKGTPSWVHFGDGKDRRKKFVLKHARVFGQFVDNGGFDKVAVRETIA